MTEEDSKFLIHAAAVLRKATTSTSLPEAVQALTEIPKLPDRLEEMAHRAEQNRKPAAGRRKPRKID